MDNETRDKFDKFDKSMRKLIRLLKKRNKAIENLKEELDTLAIQLHLASGTLKDFICKQKSKRHSR